MTPVRKLLSRPTPIWLLLPFCVLAYLWILAFGAPTRARGLDPSWTEVLAWGFLHGKQWGKDLIFTYGPTGFLQPYASYVKGIYWWYIAGELLLPAGFALTLGMLFYRCRSGLLALFIIAYVCWASRLGGDVSWGLTLLFGAVCLSGAGSMRRSTFYISLPFLAFVFGIIALAKFSLFPLWVLATTSIVASNVFRRNRGRAIAGSIAFPAALVCVWLGCAQHLSNLPLFLLRSLQVAAGYSHAMGDPAPFIVELCAVTLLGLFLLACACAAWARRAQPAQLATLALGAASATLFTLAFLTRGDHWPWFFPAMALVPFALLCDARFDDIRLLRASLLFIVTTGTIASLFVVTPSTIVHESISRVDNSIYNLFRLPLLHRNRLNEWQDIGHANQLAQIRKQVGNARIDVLTWEQGIILLNELNYAPRPVFQSYSAYTPTLARLNESYFLGPDAPPYVALELSAIDGRLPMSEDGLAMVALLKHYRPLLMDGTFLLLQRDLTVTDNQPLKQVGASQAAVFGEQVLVPNYSEPTVIFLHLDLNLAGKLYTSLFREPPLYMELNFADGKSKRYRLVRATAATGFLLSPMMESAGDWVKLYLSRPLPDIKSIIVDTDSGWARRLFVNRIGVHFQSMKPLRADPDKISPQLRAALLYPGFNIMPSSPQNLRIIDETGKRAVFIQSPGSIQFQPAKGNYQVTATYGVQEIALHDQGCLAAKPDGVGVSLIVHHGDNSKTLWHVDIDPFHFNEDKGPQQMDVHGVTVDPGDVVEYHVDPGSSENNTSCDWSYVYDLKFTPEKYVPARPNDGTFLGFNIAPKTRRLRIITNDGRDAVFLQAPAKITFTPKPGRYNIAGSYGVQSIAWHNRDCVKQGADGVGFSFVIHHADAEKVLWRQVVDPFHNPKDRKLQRMGLTDVNFAPGDYLDFRVDPGNKNNVSCDWSYIDSIVFFPRHDTTEATHASH